LALKRELAMLERQVISSKRAFDEYLTAAATEADKKTLDEIQSLKK